VIQRNKLGHVLRKDDDQWKKICYSGDEGARKTDRPGKLERGCGQGNERFLLETE